MAKNKYPILTAIVGPSKGKRFTLKKESYTCGADRKCAIRLKGEFVSDEHFMVRVRDDGNWVAENKSEYGTLVNAQRVETRILSDGDNIQIGTGNVLVFTSAESIVKEVASSGGDSNFSAKKLGIGVAILAYVAVMVYGAMVLTGDSTTGGKPSLGIGRIDTAVTDTLEYMKGQSLKTSALAEGTRTVDKAVPSYSYFRILDLQSSGDNAGELEAEYQVFEQDLHNKMYSVYQLIASGRTKAALSLLNEVYATVPDVRAPITVLALSLRTRIEGSTRSE